MCLGGIKVVLFEVDLFLVWFFFSGGWIVLKLSVGEVRGLFFNGCGVDVLCVLFFF